MIKYFSLENFWKFSQLIFLILIILSCWYAIERVCYVDSAYMLFRMINKECMIAEGGRWMNVLPQFIPWIFIKLGLPLKWIIVCFSSMQIFVLYILFLITGLFFNQKLLGVIFLLLLISSVNETFFDAVTETKFSLAFGILFLAFLNSNKHKKLIPGIVILVCGFFSHPVFIIYFLFIIGFCRIFKLPVNTKRYLMTGTIIFIVRYVSTGATTYENNLITDAIQDIIPAFNHSYIHHYFSGLFSTSFLFLTGLLMVSILQLIYTRKYTEAGFFFVSISITYFLLSVVYSKGDSPMMIQKTLLVFHFILILPIAFLWNQYSLVLQRSILLLFLLAFFSAITGINRSATKYVERVKLLNNFMQNLPPNSDKFLIKETRINHDKLLATWALPHETILLSNISLKKSLVIKNFRERNDTLLNSEFPNAFRPAFGYPMLNKELNQRYFKINESLPNLWLDSNLGLGY